VNAPQERMTVVAVVMMAVLAMDGLVMLGGSTVGAVYGDVGSADEGRRRRSSGGTDDGQSERLPESV
jgi:hypothetical protein